MPIANRTTRSTRSAPATRATRRVPRRGGGGGGSSKGSNTWMWWVGGIVISVLITGAFKLSGKSQDDKQVRKEMIELLHVYASDYSENSSYYNQLVDRYHKEAFEAAYSVGGRRTAGKVDAKAYLLQISSRMAAKASSDGKPSVAENLSALNQLVRSR